MLTLWAKYSLPHTQWIAHSGEFRLRPREVRSCPRARPATSGLSLRTVAKKPARPNSSIALICDVGVRSGVRADTGGSPILPPYSC